MARSIPERLEALGDKGEACIILRQEVDLPNGSRAKVYTLATGQRLKPAEDAPGDVFVTLDGRRRFRLRGTAPLV
jgi:hypothetical protein